MTPLVGAGEAAGEPPKRLRRAGLLLLFGEGVKRADEGRAGLRPTLFSKLITRALTLEMPSDAPPVSSELEESCKASGISPVETADEMRRDAANDFMGVKLLPVPPPTAPLLPLLLPGAVLFAELMVGLMEDGTGGLRPAIDPKEGDLETPLDALRRPWADANKPDVLDCGRLCSPSESFDCYQKQRRKRKMSRTLLAVT